jgi:Suppressor of fused protein (SUFU)
MSFSIEVLKWAKTDTDEGVAVYATLGSSRYTIPDRATEHRVEFVLGLEPEQDDVAGPLAALGLYSQREGVALNHGDTVPADKPLWPGTDMARFLITRPRPDFLSAIEVAGGVHVEFLSAIPMYESERAFKAEQGVDALITYWKQNDVPFWSSERYEAVPTAP